MALCNLKPNNVQVFLHTKVF